MNQVFEKGNLTDDPQITYTQDGKAIAKATLAVSRIKEGTDFIRITAWEKKAELMEKYCHKGQPLLIRGHIQTGSYEGKNGKVYTTDVIVDELEFCGRNENKDGSQGQPNKNPDDFIKIPDGIDEELPFN